MVNWGSPGNLGLGDALSLHPGEGALKSNTFLHAILKPHKHSAESNPALLLCILELICLSFPISYGLTKRTKRGTRGQSHPWPPPRTGFGKFQSPSCYR